MNDTLEDSEKIPDAQLVARSIGGDRDAFSILVGRYQNLACSVALGICGNPSQSEDLAQEAFVTAWKKRTTLREPSGFKSWLCGIVRNLSMRSTRKLRRESQMRDELARSDSGDDGLELDADEVDLLWKTLDSIPETYREPLILFYREEQSVAAVAEHLDVSEDVIKTRLSRGRKMMKGRVEKLVEEFLIMTRPGPVFTAAVMGALPGALATSASAATVATGVGKGAATVGGGALLGALGGMLGGYLGYRAGSATARYPEQKRIMRKAFWGSVVIVLAFCSILFVLRMFGVNSGQHWWHGAIMIAFFVVGFGWNWLMGKESRDAARKARAEGREELEKGRLRRFLGSWEGRCWDSRARFLGWPLISIAFSDPDRDYSGYTFERAGLEKEKLKTAKGWIAAGDRAVGLIAMGNLAAGGLAMGSIALGVISFGGMAAGGIAFGGVTLAVLSLGGLALGVGALGGFSGGWWSYGGAAFGWESARGGLAVARDYAVGGSTQAVEANTEVARHYFETHGFYALGKVWLDFASSITFLPVILGVALGVNGLILAIGFRRKEPRSTKRDG